MMGRWTESATYSNRYSRLERKQQEGWASQKAVRGAKALETKATLEGAQQRERRVPSSSQLKISTVNAPSFLEAC
jgi:hypothetical protein